MENHKHIVIKEH